MLKIGDNVKVVERTNEMYGKVGTVTSTLDYETRQYARVSFSSNMFDYIDVGDWKLEKIERSIT